LISSSQSAILFQSLVFRFESISRFQFHDHTTVAVEFSSSEKSGATFVAPVRAGIVLEALSVVIKRRLGDCDV
jgi:hypothetical protein